MKPFKLLAKSMALFTIAALYSCEKVIEVKSGDDTGKIVIEGTLSDNSNRALVKLTRNVSLKNANSYPAVSGAVVTVSDAAGNYYGLAEITSGEYAYPGLNGSPGQTYTLHVAVSGTSYQASSTMPNAILIDSLSAKDEAFHSDHRKEVTVHFKDPAGIANQYRFILFVNSVQVKSVFSDNDEFTDGREVNRSLQQDDIAIYKGDKVMVEMQCVDKKIYNYWNTLGLQEVQGPGGGTSPGDPPSNISNGALGYFSAHTVRTLSMVVQ